MQTSNSAHLILLVLFFVCTGMPSCQMTLTWPHPSVSNCFRPRWSACPCWWTATLLGPWSGSSHCWTVSNAWTPHLWPALPLTCWTLWQPSTIATCCPIMLCSRPGALVLIETSSQSVDSPLVYIQDKNIVHAKIIHGNLSLIWYWLQETSDFWVYLLLLVCVCVFFASWLLWSLQCIRVI